MFQLNDEQQAALNAAREATLTTELYEALEQLELALAETTESDREQIARMLIEELEETTDHAPKKLSRLLTALAVIDTPTAGEVVSRYASADLAGMDDRTQVWALIALARMRSVPERYALLQQLLVRGPRNSRIKALLLRLLIQCDEEDLDKRKEYIDQLLEMGRDGDADHRWAVLRALRNDPNLIPLPADVELRYIQELASPLLRDDFEWRDVQLQAAMVLGDVEAQRRDAMDRLAAALDLSPDPALRRYCLVAIRKVAERMNKEELDGSPFNAVTLSALEDESADVRARAAEALKSVYKPKAATELIVESLLQQDPLPAGHLEALRSIHEERATSLLREKLFHPDPDVGKRASDALLQLGGEQAFRTLLAQRRLAIEQYTEILDDADEKIMGQYNLLMRQTHLAFRVRLAMHVLIFGVGLLLLLSVLPSLWLESAVGIPLLRSALGIFGVVTGLFYHNPVASINNAVTSLVKVNVAFLGYMRQINQVDATFKHLFLDTSAFGLAEMEKTVAQIHQVVDQSLEKIDTYLPPEALVSPADAIKQMPGGLSSIAARVGIARGEET